MIPKIIHQIYIQNNENRPSEFDKLTRSWEEHFPDWNIILWKDQMCMNFLNKYYPQFVEKYQSYPENVQRADAMRYLILKTIGGMYIDNDFECVRNFEHFFNGYDFIASKEDKDHSDKYEIDYIIGNAFMASIPDNPFINHVCNKLMNYPSLDVNSGKDILDSTGPFLLTNAYYDFSAKEDVCILESEYLYPLSKWEICKLYQKEIPLDIKNRINKAYAIHYALGTWENE